ncbi:hypothetical protein F5B22DRAFT_510525 [Xylaria bambusicola]|uniref:uncharacterized protein n=1 Tax=Xylaria bambusicola TaxID=326684 RepID=UPI002007B1C2|nr:uncharacterized protein F5B22DRAFT_510525 [Xylaria bambusicola]KAI0521930.1 hypothetical protein F5B22DRAFT_510525 [Xylaria bambusicola]
MLFVTALQHHLVNSLASATTATRKVIWRRIAPRSLLKCAEIVNRKVSIINKYVYDMVFADKLMLPGHTVIDCKNPRKIDRSHVAEVNSEIAWEKIIQGARERDMDDVKEAIQEYIKACPDLTYVELESAFRSQSIEVYLIALESQAMMASLTNMDLQGNLDKKYRVNYRFSKNPARPRERELWPSDDKENLSRLEDAGEPVNRGLSKCSNCSELGHIFKNCPQEKIEKERVVIMCYNCNEPGHRIRDCEYMNANRSNSAANIS